MRPSIIIHLSRHGGASFDLLSWYSIVGIIGCLLWIAAYGFVVYTGFKEKAHGIPGPAICLNLGWEILASFVWYDPVNLWRWLDRAWFVIDLIIIGQFLYYGRGLQRSPLVRRWFYSLVAAGVLASALGQYVFANAIRDKVGMLTAFDINLVMSILFVPLWYARRPSFAGLSYGAAWTKMLGTVCTAVMGYFMFPHIFQYKFDVDLIQAMIPVYVAIFGFDVAYLYLLWRGRRAPGTSAASIAAQPSADSAA